jgi:hypothetical protein
MRARKPGSRFHLVSREAGYGVAMRFLGGPLVAEVADGRWCAEGRRWAPAEMTTEPARQRDDREGRIGEAGGWKDGGSGDVEIVDSEDPSVGIHHSVLRIEGHPRSTGVMVCAQVRSTAHGRLQITEIRGTKPLSEKSAQPFEVLLLFLRPAQHQSRQRVSEPVGAAAQLDSVLRPRPLFEIQDDVETVEGVCGRVHA